MSRDYRTMRAMLLLVARSRRDLSFSDLASLSDGWSSRRSIVCEAGRLRDEGLIESDMEFDASGVSLGGSISGLTGAGEEFARLIENDDVWRICLKTLDAAGVDLSHPLLREVCEAIVKRYVMGFIPKE